MKTDMKKLQTLLLALLMVPALGWAQGVDVNEPNEVMVPVNEVPAVVMETARAAKPGAFVTQAIRRLDRHDDYYYSLSASQVGRYWVIEVRADGELHKVFESPEPPQRLITDG